MFDGRKKRSIIQLADYGGPYSGNFIASLLAVERALKRYALRQVLVFSDIAKDKGWIAELLERNITIYILPRQSSPVKLAKEITRIAEQENAVLLHTHFTQFDVPAWMASLILRMRGRNIEVVWHVHSFLPMKKTIRRRVKDFIKFRIMGKSIMVVVLSEEMRFSLAERGLSGRMVKIFNGVDIFRATKSALTRTEIRHELGISVSARLMLVFAWDPYRKGMDLLLKAAKKISPKENIVILAVGDDVLKEFIYDTNGGLSASLVKYGRTRECVADYFRAADVFLSSSRWEGCPYSVMEAMANGLPVISSDINSLEWAKPAEGVLFYSLNDVDQLAHEIKHVSTLTQEERQRLGESNRLFIKENYSVEAWAESIISLYERILKQKDDGKRWRQDDDRRGDDKLEYH